MTDTDGVNMKNWNFKYIAFTLECIILLLVAIMLGISIRKAVRLTKETEVLQEEVKELQAELRKVEKEKAEKETEQVTEESKEVMTELQPTATPIPTATPTEAPTPTPEPMYLEDLTGYVPGDIIDDGQIDLVIEAAQALGANWDEATAWDVEQLISGVAGQVHDIGELDMTKRFAVALTVCDALLGVVAPLLMCSLAYSTISRSHLSGS